MLRLIALALTTLLAASGCATVSGSPDAGPLASIADSLGKLADNRLLTAVGQDAADTLAWVEEQKAAGKLSDLAAFRAAQCPTAIMLATADLKAKIAQLQAMLKAEDEKLTAFGALDGPHLILFLTKLRYGPAGAPGSDPKAMIASIKHDVAERVTAVADSCRAILPIREMAEILRLAAKSGLVVGTSGTAVPFLNALP